MQLRSGPGPVPGALRASVFLCGGRWTLDFSPSSFLSVPAHQLPSQTSAPTTANDYDRADHSSRDSTLTYSHPHNTCSQKRGVTKEGLAASQAPTMYRALTVLGALASAGLVAHGQPISDLGTITTSANAPSALATWNGLALVADSGSGDKIYAYDQNFTLVDTLTAPSPLNGFACAQVHNDIGYFVTSAGEVRFHFFNMEALSHKRIYAPWN